MTDLWGDAHDVDVSAFLEWLGGDEVTNEAVNNYIEDAHPYLEGHELHRAKKRLLLTGVMSDD